MANYLYTCDRCHGTKHHLEFRRTTFCLACFGVGVRSVMRFVRRVEEPR